MYPSRFYLIALLVFISAMALGALFFLSGMQSSSYILSDGVSLSLRYIDHPRYDRNLIGVIYALAFLAAGLLFLIVVLVPDERTLAAFRRVAAPQPRQRLAEAPVSPLRETPAPTSDAPVKAAPAPAPEEEGAAPEAVKEPPSREPAPEPEVTVDESVRQDVAEPDPQPDLPTLGGPDLSGEEDIVYGNGPVTEDSIIEFIQNHPDSAVKFLYRKNLDNRTLSPMDEDIYQKWERRGMFRAKVREFVLEIMDWDKLPDDYPHDIWLQLRDQIFELKARAPH